MHSSAKLCNRVHVHNVHVHSTHSNAKACKGTCTMYVLILVLLVLWWGPKKGHRADSNSMTQCSVES